MRTRAEMKEAARDLMEGNAGKLTQVVAVPGVIFLIFNMLIPHLSGILTRSLGQTTFTSAFSSIALICFYLSLLAVIQTGMGVFATFVEFSETRNAEVLTIKNAFRYCSPKGWLVFKIFFMERLYMFMSLIFLLFGPIIAVQRAYAYSMSIYNVLHAKTYYGLKTNDYLTLSRLQMHGYKGALFELDFSFLFWGFLGILTCGLGYLWIGPYQILTRIEFYKDIDALFKEKYQIAEGGSKIRPA